MAETVAEEVQGNRTQRVVANSLYNLVPQFWFLGLAILTTPFILRHLGVDAYGVLSLVTVVAGYLAFLDLGLNLAIIRFLAAHHGKGETEEIERITQTALTAFLAIAVVMTAILLLATPALTGLLRIPPNLRGEAIFAFRLGAVMFGMNLVLGVFSAVPRALQRFEIVMRLSAVLGTAQILGTVALLAAGAGLRGLMIWNCGLSAISMVAHLAVARWLLPAVRFSPKFHRATFVRLMRFSSFVMLTNFTSVAAAHSEKLMLGSMAPIAQVSYYAVPFNLIWRVLAIVPSNLFAVLLPAFSVLDLAEHRETLEDAYTRAFRFIFVVVAPATILLSVFGGDLLRLWIGEEMGRNGGPVAAVLAFGLLINAPAWVSVTIGQSMGRPGLIAWSQVIALIVLVVSGVLLIPEYGARGAAWSWLLSNLIGIPVLVLLVNAQVLKLSSRRMLMAALAKPAMVTLVVLSLAWLLHRYVDGWISLVIASAIIGVAYSAVAYRFAFDERDRTTMRTFASRFRARAA
jgi:O-antigen/teichoic acid export membrane protein